MPEFKIPYDPYPRQQLFHKCPTDEAVYGGAKGGGKSAGLVMEAFAYSLEHEGATVYLFRETYDDLEANLIKEWKSRVPRELYKYSETKKTAYLFNGSLIHFRYIRNTQDAEGYDGRSIDFIGVDELTKHTWEAIQILLSCLRSPKGFPPRFRGTCNPGGIGHTAIKNRYITPTKKGRRVVTDSVTGNTIAFIPARVYDNEAIMKNDPAYVKRLENLPPKKRAAYLHGDWDSYDGQAFEEFDPNVHVVDPFIIPQHWKRWRSVDNGYSAPFAWYWFTVDEAGMVYIYREFTRERYDPKLNFTQQAKEVVRRSVLMGGNLLSPEPMGATFVGHDAFTRHPETGKMIADFYRTAGIKGIIKASSDRKVRKATWHEYFELRETPGGHLPKVRIFRTCRKLIETLPNMVEDENDSEKVADNDYDHWYEGASYGLVGWHTNRSFAMEKPQTQLPFELREDELEVEASYIAI